MGFGISALGSGGLGGMEGFGQQLGTLTDGMGVQGGSTAGGAGAAQGTDPAAGAAGSGGFGAMLRGQMDKLGAAQADGQLAKQDMATGSVDDVAQTMLRVEQANVTLQMATQVRNKVIEAYQEVIRMQM